MERSQFIFMIAFICREHDWFKIDLPEYLFPPENDLNASIIDPEAVREVCEVSWCSSCLPYEMCHIGIYFFLDVYCALLMFCWRGSMFLPWLSMRRSWLCVSARVCVEGGVLLTWLFGWSMSLAFATQTQSVGPFFVSKNLINFVVVFLDLGSLQFKVTSHF